MDQPTRLLGRFLTASGILLGMLLAACERPKPRPPTISDATRIANARDALQSKIKGLQASRYADADFNAAYLIPAYRRGIQLLSSTGAGRLPKPVPLVAALRLHEGDDDRYRSGMTIIWLETGFSVRGVRISREDQAFLDFETWPQWDEDDRKWFNSTAWRDSAIRVTIVDVEPETNNGAVSFEKEWPVIELPRKYAEQKLSLSLLLTDGGLAGPVEVYKISVTASDTDVESQSNRNSDAGRVRGIPD